MSDEPRITPAPKNHVPREPLKKRKNVEPLPEAPLEFTAWERFTLAVDEKLKSLEIAAKLSPHIVKLIYGMIVKNWKTTITAIVGGAAVVAQALFGVVIPQEAIIATMVFLIGLFASDAKKE